MITLITFSVKIIMYTLYKNNLNRIITINLNPLSPNTDINIINGEP
jgi:hypothetical protein